MSTAVSDAGRARPLPWIAVAVVVALADQATKWAALEWLELHRPVPVVPTFDLMLTFNPGGAFSLLGDAGGWQRWLFVGLAVVIGAVLLRWLWRLPSGERWTAAALSLVLGGAAGNVFDRLFRDGLVVDFLYFHYRDFHWPAFNLADSAICVGAGILVAVSLFAGAEERPG